MARVVIKILEIQIEMCSCNLKTFVFGLNKLVFIELLIDLKIFVMENHSRQLSPNQIYQLTTSDLCEKDLSVVC